MTPLPHMTGLLLMMLGVPAGKVNAVTDIALRFQNNTGPAVIVLAAALMAVLVYYLYRHGAEGVSALRRTLLTGLRALFIGLLLLMVLRPVLSLTIEGSIRRSLVLLVDNSASMNIQDPRVDGDDLTRSAIALGVLDPSGGLQQSLDPGTASTARTTGRLSLVRAVLENQRLNLLDELQRDFDVTPFAFGDVIEELSLSSTNPVDNRPSLAWMQQLRADRPVTAIGDALREITQRKRGQPLAGVVLATDGANNSGTDPLKVAEMLRTDAVPLFIYGVGMTAPRDIIVANVLGEETVFVKDDVPLQVLVRGLDVAGQSARMTVRLGSRTVEERMIAFSDQPEQLVEVTVRPEEKGEHDVTVSIEPVEGESVRDNNAVSHRLRVVDTRIKVLYIEQYPRHEFKFLQPLLARDRRIDAKFVLFDADRQIAEYKGTPYLKEVPQDKDDLFQFDVIVFGDVDPRYFGPVHQDNLREFVSQYGGALVVIPGRQFNPWSYRQTALARLLPVDLESARFDSSEFMAFQPVRLELTAAGRSSPMLRLSDKESESAQRWQELAPVYWVARVAGAKPAAEVLAVDPDPIKSSRFEKMPVIAVQQYGLGQVLWMGTDNTWRWRRNEGARWHEMIWSQILQRLAQHRLLGKAKRTQLNADRQQFNAGDRVTIYARLYDANFDPVKLPSVSGRFMPAAKGAAVQQDVTGEVSMRPLPDQPGLYRGEFGAPLPGAYTFCVESDPDTTFAFHVVQPRFEFGDTAMNERLLQRMAAASGGAFFREENLADMVRIIRETTESAMGGAPDAVTGASTRTGIRSATRVRSTTEVEVWCTPLYFLLLLAVVSAEWILRKICHLK